MLTEVIYGKNQQHANSRTEARQQKYINRLTYPLDFLFYNIK